MPRPKKSSDHRDRLRVEIDYTSITPLRELARLYARGNVTGYLNMLIDREWAKQHRKP